MATYKDPWADAGNQAVGALYKYIMSQPSGAQMESQALQNELARANLRAAQQSYDIGQLELGQAQTEQEAARKFREAYGALPTPGTITEGPVAPTQFGPGSPTTITPEQYGGSIADLMTQYAPTLGKDVVESTRGALGTAGALRFEDPIQRQLALDKKAATYSAYLPTAGGGVRGAKIADAMMLHGLSQAEATKLVDGQLRITTNPVTGNLNLTDMTTGQTRLLESAVGGPPDPMPTAGVVEPVTTTPRELSFDPTIATGAEAALKNVLTGTIGQFVPQLAFQGPERAAQKMRVLERDLIKSLASSSRPPVIEQERITSMLGEPFQWTENPRVAAEKVASVVDLMTQQYNADARVANDPTMPKNEKVDAIRRMNEIKRTLSSVVSPEHLDTLFPTVGLPGPGAPLQPPAGTGLTPGAIEDGYRFLGGDPADPNSWEKVQ